VDLLQRRNGALEGIEVAVKKEPGRGMGVVSLTDIQLSDPGAVGAESLRYKAPDIFFPIGIVGIERRKPEPGIRGTGIEIIPESLRALQQIAAKAADMSDVIHPPSPFPIYSLAGTWEEINKGLVTPRQNM
jgi:hypothetical protein